MPWDLTGNSGTNPATDFLGTSDNQPLVIRTSGTEALRIDGSGAVFIGGTTGIQQSLGFLPRGVSVLEFGQGAGTPLVLRRDESPQIGVQSSQNVLFTLDPTNGVFNLDVGGTDNSKARIHLGDPVGADNPVTTMGRVGIGTTTPQQKLTVEGQIQSTTGGFRFPDGTVQTTATQRGPAGPQGPQEPEGPKGPPGVATGSSAVCAGSSSCSCGGGTRLSFVLGPCVVTSDTGSCQAFDSNGTCCVCIA
jgi:hypothetical protein